MGNASGDSTPRFIRFGAFTLDVRTRELSREGTRVRLHGMPVEVLALLLERAGDLVTRRELRERLWPDGTFLDYENSLNSAIARLREALRDSADAPTFIETLPKRGYRFIAAVHVESEVVHGAEGGEGASAAAAAAVDSAVPPAASTSTPLPEVSPDVFAPRDTAPRSWWRRPLIIGGASLAAAAVVGALVVGWPSPRPDETAERVMLAVLPFENLTGSSEHDYLSDGFTEEIITQLARVDSKRLGVIARTTAMSYKGMRVDVARVGRDLSVDYVLEGSVRGGDDTLRFTAQLVRVADQTHLWAETFDRPLSSVLDTERDVSEAVRRQVARLLGMSAGGPPDRSGSQPHPDAYAAYLRARFHHGQATVQGIESAIASYRAALAVDPSYALAQAGLARAYIFGVRLKPAEALRLAHEMAKKALVLDPALPEGQLALAMTTLYYLRDWDNADREFRRAIERDPGNAEAHFYYSHLLAARGRHDEAIAAVRRAQRLDPHSTLIGHYVGRHLFMARRYEEALRELQRTLELDPNYTWTQVFLFLTYEKLGRLPEALAHRQKYLTLIGRPASDAAELASLYATRGYPAVLEEWAAITLDYFKRNGHVTSGELVHLYAALGRTEEALDWLDRAVEDHTRDLIYLAVDPGYDPLGNDERYWAHVMRLALPTFPKPS